MYKKLLMTALMSSILFLGSNMNAQAAVIYLNIIDLAGASQLMDVETTQIITIKDLKNKIHATYGIAPDQQKLVLGNTKLEENQTLGYYGITDGLTVNILSLNTATDFSNFNTYTGSSATGVINLTEDMKATANINTQTSPNLEINGNGYTLDGNKALPTDTHGQFMGFNFNVGQALTLRNLTMKNFYGNAGDPLVAIHNNLGTLSIYDSIFSNNSGITRGAIYNIGAANIYNSTFTNNSSKNYGGAIHHASGILNIYNSEFSGNTNWCSGGTISNNATLNIYNSDFSDNSSSHESGGAIYNNSTANIYNTTFARNHSATGWVGGAIVNYSNLNLYNSTFKDNVAGTNGGAIINASGGTTTIYNSTFTGNTATNDRGGAIYNEVSTLNLIANGGNTIFTGNTTSLGSNAIYSTEGTTNLNAGFGEIIFNDGISSSINTTNGLNINKTGTAPTSGRIILNNALTGYSEVSDSLNLYNTGTLKLGSYTNTLGTTSYGTIGVGGTPINLFTMNDDSILDLTNGRTNDTVHIKYFTSAGTPRVWSDIDLTNSGADKIHISRPITNLGVLQYKTFRMLNEGVTNTVEIFPTTNKPTIAVAPTYTNNYKYTVTDNSGTLTFTRGTPTDGLIGALDATDERSFSLLSNYQATSNLNAHAITGELTIFGKDKQYSIAGGSDSSAINSRNNLFAINPGSKLNIFDTVIKNSYTTAGGGAILNNGIVNLYNSDFNHNASNYGQGGAIYNNGTANIYNSNFAYNSAGDEGGAIHNVGNLNIANSTFSNNTAHNGGAIMNWLGTTNILNSTFTGNTSAAGFGGAIANYNGTINLIADGGNVEFTGNKAGGVPNALQSRMATTNLNAGNGQIIFNDRISSILSDNTININGRNDAKKVDNSTIFLNAPTQGTVVLNEDMTGFGNHSATTDNTVNLYNGTVKLGPNAKFFEAVDFNMYQGSTLDMQNNKIDNINVDTLSLKNAGSSYVKIDADLAKGTADNFMGTVAQRPDGSGGWLSTIDTNAKLSINKINVLSDTAPATTKIQIANDANLKAAITLDNTQKSVTGPVYKYAVDYDNANGILSFQGGGNSYSGYNPRTFASGVAAQANGFLGAVASYNEVLGRVDQPLLDDILLQNQLGYSPKLLNKTASAAGNPEFSPLMDASKKPTAWFRPFSSFENVPLNNGPRVSSVAYGSTFGSDCGLKSLKRGYQYMMTGFGGYTGSHQTYDGTSLYQNGGFGGIMGTLYKGDFFTALATTVGASNISSNSSPDFGMLNAGLASRTGYNHRMLNNKFILQPNYLMSYTFINTQDYTNNQGVRISTAPLNAMQIAPGVKLIANMKDGWQPYLCSNMVFNLLDKSNVTANDISLPQVSVDPYVEYGAGVQKKHGERFTGFFQSMLRNGGRNGVTLFAGFKWAI